MSANRSRWLVVAELIDAAQVVGFGVFVALEELQRVGALTVGEHDAMRRDVYDLLDDDDCGYWPWPQSPDNCVLFCCLLAAMED